MRAFLGLFVLILLLSSSALVQSKSRTEKEVMAYGNLFTEYAAFEKLAVNPEKAWSVVGSFIPSALWKSCSDDPQKALHLVEIYLRSHGLAPCGHEQIHETVGTACSFSRGTKLHRLFVEILLQMYQKKAMNGRCLLYLLEREPEGWSAEAKWFFYNGRIISSGFTISDKEVDEQRKKFVEEGFQTAIHWSNDEIRKALLRHQQGRTLEYIDQNLQVKRGEVARIFVNFIVRPLYLLLNESQETYEGKLAGLTNFVTANIQTNTLPAATPAATPTPAPTAVPVPRATPVTTPALKAAVKEALVLPKREIKTQSGFARAYGGSRFGMAWGK